MAAKIYDIDGSLYCITDCTPEYVVAELFGENDSPAVVEVGQAPDGLYAIWLEGNEPGSLYRISDGAAVHVGPAGPAGPALDSVADFHAVVVACEVSGALDSMVVMRMD